jgi:hypothetical protein
MPRYEIVTLVDITRSAPTRSDTDRLKIGQQSNFNSLIQTIGLRSNIEWIKDPISQEGRLPGPLNGKAKHWYWEFDVEREQVFERDNDPVGLLIDDLHGVPVIVNLTETAEIKPTAFQTKGDSINTIVNII